MRGVAPWGMRSRSVAGSRIGVSLGVTSTSTSGCPTAIRLTMPPGRSRIACSAGGEPMATISKDGPQVLAFDDQTGRPASDGRSGDDPHVRDADRLGTSQAKLIEQVVDGIGGDRSGDVDPHATALDGLGPGPQPQPPQIGPQSIDVALAAGAGGLDRAKVGLQLGDLGAQHAVAIVEVRDQHRQIGRAQLLETAGGVLRSELHDQQDAEHERDQRHRGERARLPHGVAPAPPGRRAARPGGVERPGRRRRA